MKKKLSIPLIALMLVFASCEKSLIETDSRNVSTKKSAQDESGIANSANKGQVVFNFRAHLSGDQEVPPRETLAQGQAVFQLSKDGQELSYKLIVAGLDNLSMSHIHVAPEGTNGPIVVWLYPPAPPAVLLPGTTNGILQEGVIRKTDLRGILAGKELSALIDLMIDGRTYANIHTSQFPGGEIRGQIRGNVKPD